jgi:nucleoside-diphosphate-sugar epimerase
MGGAGFVFTGENDADIMHNSALINLNIAHRAVQVNLGKLFYSSSACCYPEFNQLDPNNPNCSEDSAYPAQPDSEYGFEKLFSERLYLSFARNKNLQVRIARFHNIFGPMGSWNNGREKAPAALARKVSLCPDNGTIEVWGDGCQTRSFLYVDECVEGVLRLMDSDFTGPVNIGSEEMISINDFVKMIAKISGKTINIKHIKGPTGVRGRNSDNRLIFEKLGWKPTQPLEKGMEKTYKWIKSQIDQGLEDPLKEI